MRSHILVRAMDNTDSREDISIEVGGLAWVLGQVGKDRLHSIWAEFCIHLNKKHSPC